MTLAKDDRCKKCRAKLRDEEKGGDICFPCTRAIANAESFEQSQLEGMFSGMRDRYKAGGYS